MQFIRTPIEENNVEIITRINDEIISIKLNAITLVVFKFKLAVDKSQNGRPTCYMELTVQEIIIF